MLKHELTQEVHILHDYGEDFYGEYMSAVVLGFIRPEYDYNSLGAPPSRLLSRASVRVPELIESVQMRSWTTSTRTKR